MRVVGPMIPGGIMGVEYKLTYHMKTKQRATTLQMKMGFLDEDLKKPKHDEILKWLDQNAEQIVNSLFRSEQWDKELINRLTETTSKIVSDTKQKGTLQQEVEDLEWKLKNSPRENDKEGRLILDRKIAILESLEKWDGIQGQIPEKLPIRIARKIWEHPITSSVSNQRTGYQSPKQIIGYVDMKIIFVVPRLTVNDIDFSGERIMGPDISWLQTELLQPEFGSREQNVHYANFEAKTVLPSLGELFRQLNTYKEFEGGNYVILCPDDSDARLIKEQGFYFCKYK